MLGMFGLAGRRLAEGLIALFALLGFTLVPLGRKTALEHARDIFTTPAAADAFRELGGATLRLREKLTGAILQPEKHAAPLDPGHAVPKVPELPAGRRPKAP